MLSAVIACLCLVGLYISAFMLRKQVRGERGAIKEPSVVFTPRASAMGPPNSLLGLLFYLALLLMAPFLSNPIVWMLATVASTLAAALSVYLAYSLLFVTRMPCAYCWTGHVINWLLLGLLIVHARM